MDCSGSVQGQVAGPSECGNEPSGSINVGNFFTSWRSVSFSGRTLLHGCQSVGQLVCRLARWLVDHPVG
jgi:hypothetical protein